MINPFASFLQPQYRSIEGAPSFGEIESIGRGRRQDTQRALENTQQNALAQRGANRADAELALQQGEQSHRFTAEEQKQVEGLLAEYQDAEDQGDQVRLSRASQMLKRFGMDVSQGKPKPDLQALTGQKPPPLPGKLLPDVQAFTGQKPATPQEAPDLSQADFESQLINNPLPEPSRYEQIDPKTGKPGTTAEYKAMISPDEPEDLGDVDDPAFKADAAKEGGVIDLDKEDPTPLQVGQLPKVATQQAPQAAASQSPPRLASQLLPTIVSKGGKQLYESTGPSGRWGPMVAGVFEPFTQHDNPEIGAAAKRAQAMAAKLIEVDGVAPKDAIKLGMDYLNGEAGRLAQLERTKIGSKAHVAGAAAGAPGFNIKDRRFYTGEMHESVQKFKNENIESGIRGYDSALTALNSSNVASQNDAIQQLIAARSGKTVSDRERALYQNISGIWDGLQKQYNMAAGEAMPESAKAQLRGLLKDARGAVAEAREERAKAAEQYHRRKLLGAPGDVVDNDARGVADAIRMGAQGGTEEEDLY